MSTSQLRRSARITLAVALVALCALVAVAFSFFESKPFYSVEYSFTDTSKQGLAIVPASCPSNPDYPGQCNAVIMPPPPPPTNCAVYATRSVISPNESTTISWSTLSCPVAYQTGGVFGANGTGCAAGGLPVVAGLATLSGLGAVPLSGTMVVSPQVSTTYTLNGQYYTQNGTTRTYIDTFLCSVLVNVNECPVGMIMRGGTCVDAASAQCIVGPFCSGPTLYYQHFNAAGQCTNDLIQECPYGCSRGACNDAPGNATLGLVVRPSLVRKGETTLVSWSSQNTASCTVRGTNGDSWTGASGTQTTSAIQAHVDYTLTCLDRSGRQMPQQRAFVNVIPVFIER